MGQSESRGFSLLSRCFGFYVFFFFFLKKWSFFAFSPMSESVFIKWLLLFNFRAVVSKDIYKHQIEAVS